MRFLSLCIFKFIVLYALCCCTSAVLYGYEDPSLNVVNNWDFEEDISGDDWTLCATSAERVEGGYTGNYSLRVFDRDTRRGSPCQYVNAAEKGLKKSTFYYFSVFNKVLSYPRNETNPFVRIKGYAQISLASGEKVMKSCGELPFAVTDGIWYQMGGDFKTPDEDFTEIRLFLQVEPVDTEFLVDTWSLIELEHDPNWRTNLYEQARTIRMENQTVIGNIGSSIEVIPGQTMVKIELSRHEIGIGTALRADNFNDVEEVNINYKNFITSHFNWIVFENDMKWKPMEGDKGNIKFERIDEAMAYLEPYNMTYRGHSLLWDIMDNQPDWVQELSGEELIPEINRRIEYMLEYFNGRVFEWDVNNEFLHGHYYEETTGNWTLMDGMFLKSKALDPGARMCLNDYEIARGSGILASAQANLAIGLTYFGIPVDCVGIQSHLRELPVSPEALQKRIDIVAAAGLPLSITELSLHSYNMSIRTEGVELAFRLYMAHPSIESITLWGFGDQFITFADDFYLTEGTDFTPNEAGQMFLDLLYGDYHTSEEVLLTENSFTYEFPAFRGNYRLTVENSGVVEYETDFYVGKEGDHVFTFTTP